MKTPARFAPIVLQGVTIPAQILSVPGSRIHAEEEFNRDTGQLNDSTARKKIGPRKLKKACAVG